MMFLIATLILVTTVCGHFDITYPKGIPLNFSAQEYACEYDPSAPVYPWHKYGSPLGLNQHVDKTLLEVYYCGGSNWKDYSDWDMCILVNSYVQTVGGEVCMERVEVGEEELGVNGTLRILYYEGSGDFSSLVCIPITISDDGPEWNGSNCKTEKKTQCRLFEGDYWEDVYGPTVEDMLLDNGYNGNLDVHYVTYTEINGKTSEVYEYYFSDWEGLVTKLDTSTIKLIHDAVTSDEDFSTTETEIRSATTDDAKSVSKTSAEVSKSSMITSNVSSTTSVTSSTTTSVAVSSPSSLATNSSSSSSSNSTSVVGLGAVVAPSSFIALLVLAANILAYIA